MPVIPSEPLNGLLIIGNPVKICTSAALHHALKESILVFHPKRFRSSPITLNAKWPPPPTQKKIRYGDPSGSRAFYWWAHSHGFFGITHPHHPVVPLNRGLFDCNLVAASSIMRSLGSITRRMDNQQKMWCGHLKGTPRILLLTSEDDMWRIVDRSFWKRTQTGCATGGGSFRVWATSCQDIKGRNAEPPLKDSRNCVCFTIHSRIK